jgi:hypothetical protein
LEEKITAIEAHNSPLYDLLETAKKFCNLEITSAGLQVCADSTQAKIKSFVDDAKLLIFDESRLDELEEIYSEIIEKITELSASIGKAGAEENIGRITRELGLINRELIMFRRWMAVECRVDDAEQLREMLLDRITDEDVITDKYIEIENMANAILEEKITIDEFESLIDKKKREVDTALSSYNNFYLSREEWTMETALGDRMLREGASEYLDSLEMLRESCLDNDQDYAEIALDNLFEANVKLVTVQKLAEYVKEQAAIA